MKRLRTKKNTKAADKRQVKWKSTDIGTSIVQLPLIEGDSVAPILLLEWTLAVLQDLAANFMSLDTHTVSVYNNTAKYIKAIAESNV